MSAAASARRSAGPPASRSHAVRAEATRMLCRTLACTVMTRGQRCRHAASRASGSTAMSSPQCPCTTSTGAPPSASGAASSAHACRASRVSTPVRTTCPCRPNPVRPAGPSSREVRTSWTRAHPVQVPAQLGGMVVHPADGVVARRPLAQRGRLEHRAQPQHPHPVQDHRAPAAGLRQTGHAVTAVAHDQPLPTLSIMIYLHDDQTRSAATCYQLRDAGRPARQPAWPACRRRQAVDPKNPEAQGTVPDVHDPPK